MESVSPLGRIPVLYDGETHLYESGEPCSSRLNCTGAQQKVCMFARYVCLQTAQRPSILGCSSDCFADALT